MADALKELLVAYSSGGSDADMEETAQSKSCGSSDNENCSNDDVIVGDVESAPNKPKTFGLELQLHNYFSLPAQKPTPDEKVQLAKNSDSSHVMRPTGKLAVFVVPATLKDQARRKLYHRKRRLAEKAALRESVEKNSRESFEKLSEDSSMAVDAVQIEMKLMMQSRS